MDKAQSQALKTQADEFVRLNAVQFLSKNARRYSWNSFYGQAQNGMFCQVDPQPFEARFLLKMKAGFWFALVLKVNLEQSTKHF